MPGNWIQVTQGIEDSPENLVSDMLVGGDNKGDPELVAIIANGALDSANWLTYEGGVSWKHDLMQFGGHNIKRSIIPITHSGSEMTTKLTNRVNGMDDIVLVDNTKAVELVTDDAGARNGRESGESRDGRYVRGEMQGRGACDGRLRLQCRYAREVQPRDGRQDPLHRLGGRPGRRAS